MDIEKLQKMLDKAVNIPAYIGKETKLRMVWRPDFLEMLCKFKILDENALRYLLFGYYQMIGEYSFSIFAPERSADKILAQRVLSTPTELESFKPDEMHLVRGYMPFLPELIPVLSDMNEDQVGHYLGIYDSNSSYRKIRMRKPDEIELDNPLPSQGIHYSQLMRNHSCENRDSEDEPASSCSQTQDEELDRILQSVLKNKELRSEILQYITFIIRISLLMRATDIHMNETEVEFRIDGRLVLPPIQDAQKNFYARNQKQIIQCIKTVANINLGKPRLPDQGSFSAKKIKLNDSSYFRLQSFPVGEDIYGVEVVTIRVLEQEIADLNPSSLNFPSTLVDFYERLVMNLITNGLLNVTGPTGSGKSTTMAAILMGLMQATRRKTYSIEDPIERKLPGVIQLLVNSEMGRTFQYLFRSILRGDPEVIMVGEMRDLVTFEIAMQASDTGHLVLSTVHANDAISTIERLLDMGVSKGKILSVVRGIAAQRLVGITCEHCRAPYSPTPTDLLIFPELSGRQVFRAVGCPACNRTGYDGRLLIAEFLDLTNEQIKLEVYRALHGVNSATQTDYNSILRVAKENGMVTMRKDAFSEVKLPLSDMCYLRQFA